MAITSIKTGSSFTNLVKYNDFLAGNPAFSPSSYESIASATSSAASTIDFNTISGSYSSLQIRASFTQSSGNPFRIRFNSDSGTNYSFHYLNGAGASGVSAGGTATTSGIQLQSQYGSDSSKPICVIIDLLDYNSTTKYKTLRSIDGWDGNGSGVISLSSGLWQSTSAITSISISAVGGGTFTGTTALYGIKG